MTRNGDSSSQRFKQVQRTANREGYQKKSLMNQAILRTHKLKTYRKVLKLVVHLMNLKKTRNSILKLRRMKKTRLKQTNLEQLKFRISIQRKPKSNLNLSPHRIPLHNKKMMMNLKRRLQRPQKKQIIKQKMPIFRRKTANRRNSHKKNSHLLTWKLKI